MSIWIRLLGQNFTAFQQIAFRNLVGFFIGAAVVILLRKKVIFHDVPKHFLFLYTITFPCEVVFWTFSILQTKILTATAIFYAGSLLGSFIIGKLVFKEKVTSRKVFSLVLVLIGLGIYLYPFSLDQLNIGVVFALIAGCLDTAANSFRKYLSGKIDRLVLALLPMIGGIIITFFFMALLHQTTLPIIAPLSWVVGGIFGLMVLSVSYFTLVGFQNFDLNLGTIVLSAELIFGPVFAYLIFKEKPSSQEFFAALCILAAIIVMNIPSRKKEVLP